MLVVMSGLPASGKSTIADEIGRALGAPVFSVDPIEAAIMRSGISRSFETGLAAYVVAATLAEHQLRLGLDVVTDSSSYLEVAREMWRAAARNARTPMCAVEVVCSDLDVHRARLEARERSIEGFPEPTWEQVMQIRAEWEPWTEDRIVVDSLRPNAENVAAILDYVRS